MSSTTPTGSLAWVFLPPDFETHPQRALDEFFCDIVNYIAFCRTKL